MRAQEYPINNNNKSLNPCCNGIYSMSKRTYTKMGYCVLILVVMEYTQ